jgi:hypothetical protein
VLYLHCSFGCRSILCNSFINFSRHSFIEHSLRSCLIKLMSKGPFINLVAQYSTISGLQRNIYLDFRVGVGDILILLTV